MSLFVTATGTEVGKTAVCAAILLRYGRQIPLTYWKPVATGGSESWDERDFVKMRCLAGHRGRFLEEMYLYDPPVSPHLAARRARRPIDPDAIVERLVAFALEERERSIVIEGIGGALVPLTDHGYLVAQLARDFALPCLVVASSTLGTINHTLMTLEVLRSRSVEIAGVVLNGPRDLENKRAIEKFGDVEVLAELDHVGKLSRPRLEKIMRRFDPKATIKRFLA